MYIDSNVGIQCRNQGKTKNGGAKVEGGGVHFIQTSFLKYVCVCGASSPTMSYYQDRWPWVQAFVFLITKATILTRLNSNHATIKRIDNVGNLL